MVLKMTAEEIREIIKTCRLIPYGNLKVFTAFEKSLLRRYNATSTARD